MSDEILRSSAALNALKRHQLVSLSKRYGLKASGKNVDLIERLQDYAVTHAGDLDFYIPEPAPTPGPSVFSDPPTSPPPTPFTSNTTLAPQALAPTPLNHKVSKMSVASRRSDAWEVLSESGASLISPKKAGGMTKSDSMRSWRSSNNGEALTDFGENHDEQPRSTNSMKALATSLTRRGSRILLGRSVSSSSRLDVEAQSKEVETPTQDDEPMEQVVNDVPPSPASTVGVPRRHSTISILERPSTVRLCSPAPTSPGRGDSDHDPDDLPFFTNTHALKERKSMAPIRSPTGTFAGLQPTALSRKSMPAISASSSASISAVYPPLPIIPSEFAAPSIPGGFPPLPPTPQANGRPMVFGSPVAQGVSNQQFSDAAQALLKEMNARLPGGGVSFGEELLKGKKAEMDKLVHVNKDLGTGGWGLGLSGSSGSDRYAAAHQKEFAKMRSISKNSIDPKASTTRQLSGASIESVDQSSALAAAPKRKHELTTSTSALPSAPNGLPLHADVREHDGRETKRKRLSAGPNYLGSLREAGKSLANILGEEKGKSGDATLRKMKDRREKRRSSLIHNGSKAKSMTSRFGFFRNKKATPAPPADLAASTSSAMSPSYVVPTPIMPRKTSVYAPREPPQPKKRFDLEASLARKPTATRRTSTDLSNAIKRHPEILSDARHDGQAQKDRSRSTSAHTVLSTVSSEAKRRSRIPDFAPPAPHDIGGSNKAAMSSTNTLGLPKSSSISTHLGLSVKKQSQVDLIRNARPVPPPPDSTISSSTSMHTSLASSTRPPASASINRSSTLYLPTASSLARMQATLKPNPERPLPSPPAVGQPQTIRLGSTVQPFGAASSRDNLFESNFHLPRPASNMAPPPLKPQSSSSAHKTPGKGKSTSLAAARIRARASGLSAVKSKGNLRDEMEMKRKRSEIKAKQGRIAEERELRGMLGGVEGRGQENVPVDADVSM